MSLKLGTQDIAGISQNKICNAHFLLEAIWSDHIINDISFLRADTFSWQSGDVYVTVYNHLIADLQGTTAETETIGSYTVTFYRATDGHKICLADQETTIANIYSETGIAWYYILDTTNTQFKLPRTKYGFEGLRTNVGDKIDESLPNITGKFPATVRDSYQNYTEGAFADYSGTGGPGGSNGAYGYTFNASRSSSTYQDNAPVQERATQMYLYFYVGDYTQTAIEQTAGLNSELFNDKVDKSSLQEVQCVVETYQNGTSWYRVWSDGWCEQGGTMQGGVSIAFLKPFTNANYTLAFSNYYYSADVGTPTTCYYDKSSTGFSLQTRWNGYGASIECSWQACGYIKV